MQDVSKIKREILAKKFSKNGRVIFFISSQFTSVILILQSTGSITPEMIFDMI